MSLGYKPGLDFFGVNFYSRGVVGFFCQPTCMPGEEMTEMPYGESVGTVEGVQRR